MENKDIKPDLNDIEHGIDSNVEKSESPENTVEMGPEDIEKNIKELEESTIKEAGKEADSVIETSEQISEYPKEHDDELTEEESEANDSLAQEMKNSFNKLKNKVSRATKIVVSAIAISAATIPGLPHKENQQDFIRMFFLSLVRNSTTRLVNSCCRASNLITR